MTRAERAVARGVRRLDRDLPGWWRDINLAHLDLLSSRDCVLGQIARRRHLGAGGHLDRWAMVARDVLGLGRLGITTHGFDAFTCRGMDVREHEWRNVIAARQQADWLLLEVEKGAPSEIPNREEVECLVAT